MLCGKLFAQYSNGSIGLGGLFDFARVKASDYENVINQFKGLDFDKGNLRSFDIDAGKWVSNWDAISDAIDGADYRVMAYFRTLEDGNGVIHNTSASVEGMQAYLKQSGQAFDFAAIKATAFNAILNAGISLAITAGLQLVIKLIDDVVNRTEHLIEAGKEARNTIASIGEDLKTKSSVKNSGERFDELRVGVDQSTNENISLTNEQYTEYLSLCNEIAEVYPSLVTSYDEQGNAILNLGTSAQTATEQLKDLYDVDQQLANIKISDNLQDVYNGILAESNQKQAEIDDLRKKADEAEESLDKLSDSVENSIFDQLDKIASGESNTITLDTTMQNSKEIIGYLRDSFNDLGILLGEPIYSDLNGDGITESEILTFLGLPSEDQVDSVIGKVKEKYFAKSRELNTEIQQNRAENLYEASLMEREKDNLWNGLLSPVLSSIETNPNYNLLSEGIQNGIKDAISSFDFSNLENEADYDGEINSFIKKKFLYPIVGAFDGQDDKQEIQDAFNSLFSPDILNLNATDYKTAVDDALDTLHGYFNEIYGSAGDERFEDFTIRFGFKVEAANGEPIDSALKTLFDLAYNETATGDDIETLKTLSVDQLFKIKDTVDDPSFDGTLSDAIDQVIGEAQNQIDSAKPLSFASLFEGDDETSLTKQVDDFQSKISTIHDTIEKLNNGEEVNLTDLMQQFGGLSGNAETLKEELSAIAVQDLHGTIESIKSAMNVLSDPNEIAKGENFIQSLIDSLDFSSLENVDVSAFGKTLSSILTENLSAEEMEIVRAYKDAIDARNNRIEEYLVNGEDVGNKVDLNHRPVVLNDDGSFSTIESETFNFSDFGINKEGAFNVTPILPNGERIENLGDYIQDIIDSGGDIEDSNIFLGAYENLEDAVDAAETLHEEQQSMYADEASALQGIIGMSESYGWNFITPEDEQTLADFIELLRQYASYKASLDLSDIIQGEEFTNKVSTYTSDVQNLIAVRQKLNKQKGKLDTSDLKEAIETCPELIHHLGDLEGGVDSLIDAANDDALKFFAQQIDELRAAGRNADADALQRYADSIIESVNTVEESFVKLGNLKVKTPDVSALEEALETENQGKTYDNMVSWLTDMKEAYEKGLLGTDEIKKFAALLSPSGSEGMGEFANNLEKAKRYLTEDSSGLHNFLQDMKDLGYASDESGEWTWDLGNGLYDIQEAADKAGMSVSFLMAMFGKAEDYGAYNDFFLTEEDGAEHIEDLYSELAAEKRHLAEIEANPDMEGYETAIEDSKSKISELEERIKTTKKDLEEFTASTPEQIAERAKYAADVAKDLQQQIELSTDDQEKAALQKEIEDFMKEYHLVLDVDGNFSSIEEEASNLDLDVNLDATGSNLDSEISKVSEYVQQLQNGAVFNVDDGELESARTVLEYLIDKKHELEAPAVMSIGTEELQGASESVTNAITAIQEFQTAYNELEKAQTLGVDTTDAQAKLDAARQAVEAIDTATQQELGLKIDVDADNLELVEQIADMDLSMFDDMHKLSYVFDIQNKEDLDAAIEQIDKLPKETQNVDIVINTDNLHLEDLSTLNSSIARFIDSNPKTKVTVNGTSVAVKQANEVNAALTRVANNNPRPSISVNDTASSIINDIKTKLDALDNKHVKTYIDVERRGSSLTTTDGGPRAHGTPFIKSAKFNDGYVGIAHASGTVGEPKDTVALTGEEDKELVV